MGRVPTETKTNNIRHPSTLCFLRDGIPARARQFIMSFTDAM